MVVPLYQIFYRYVDGISIDITIIFSTFTEFYGLSQVFKYPRSNLKSVKIHFSKIREKIDNFTSVRKNLA